MCDGNSQSNFPSSDPLLNKYLTTVEYPPANNVFRISSLNIRSINNKVNDLIELLNKTNCSIFALQETWLKHTDSAPLIPGYHPPLFNSRKTLRGGGTALYVKNNFPIEPIKDNLFNERKIETTGCIVTVNKIKLLIISVYMGFEDQWDSISNLKLHISRCMRTYKCKNVVLAGDFNINLLNNDSNGVANHILTDLGSINLLPVINAPTRITQINQNTTQSLIDNIYITSSISFKSFIGVDTISDHLICNVDLQILKTTQNKVPIIIKTRNFNEKNLLNLEKIVSLINWKYIKQLPLDRKVEFLQKEIDQAIRISCPITEKTIKGNQNQPWITPGLAISKKTEQKLYKKYLKHKSNQTFNDFKQYQKTFKKVVKHAKNTYFKTLLQEHYKNSKMQWQIINKLCHRKIKSTPKCFKINGKIESDPKIIADGFNTYFSSVGANLAEKFDVNDNFLNYLDKKNTTFGISQVNQQTIDTLIKNLSSKKSHGHDLLSNSLLKRLRPYLVKPLQNIVNCSIRTGKYPKAFKVTRVIVLHKKGPIDTLSNYRPISLSPIASKLLERVVSAQVYKYMEKTPIFSPNSIWLQIK